LHLFNPNHPKQLEATILQKKTIKGVSRMHLFNPKNEKKIKKYSNLLQISSVELELKCSTQKKFHFTNKTLYIPNGKLLTLSTKFEKVEKIWKSFYICGVIYNNH